jgi:hypothetical protein
MNFNVQFGRNFRSQVLALKGVWLGLTVLVLLSALSALPAFGGTITVTNTNDSGPGSLRDAIATAASGDTINFAFLINFRTINLTSAPITVDKSLTISGPGASRLAIDGGFSVGVFVVNGGVAATISGINIESGGSLLGGCIFNAGTLTLTDATVTNCRNPSELGGGILNAGTAATLNLISSTVTGNLAGCSLVPTILGAGGGIFNFLGTVNLTKSTVSFNFTEGGLGASGDCISGGSLGSGGGGGGIFNFAGTVAVNSSTVSSNFTSFGGGIYNGAGGTLTVVNSTFAGNQAAAAGGGILNDGSSVTTLSNTTMWGNSTASRQDLGLIVLNLPSSGGGDNGGVFRIAPNFGAGGVLNIGTVTLKNSILAANTETDPDTNNLLPGNCGGSGTITSLGHNLSDAGCVGAGPGDLNNTPAGLDPGGLKNNGGPTQTVALLATSPAVNDIPLSDCRDVSGSPVATDQRGVLRPQGAGCDIGAFEYFASRFPIAAVQTFLLIDSVQSSPIPLVRQPGVIAPLQAAVDSLNQGNVQPAIGQLGTFINQVSALVHAGTITAQQASTLTTPAQTLIQSLAGAR